MGNPFRKKTKLRFVTNADKKSKNKKIIIISFILLVLLIGTFSLIYFLKSYDYDLKKAFGMEKVENKDDKKSAVKLEGESTFFVASTSLNKDKLYFASLVKVDLDKQKISVACMPTDATVLVNSSSISLQQAYVDGGSSALVSAAEAYSEVEIDKYIVINEKNIKAFMQRLGNYKIEIKQNINYTSENFTFNLYEGNQILTGDKLLKYIRYQQFKGGEYLNNQANIISDVIDQILTTKNFNEDVDKFDEVANLIDTDISVVDFTKSKSKIIAFTESPDRQKTESVDIGALRK